MPTAKIELPEEDVRIIRNVLEVYQAQMDVEIKLSSKPEVREAMKERKKRVAAVEEKLKNLIWPGWSA